MHDHFESESKCIGARLSLSKCKDVYPVLAVSLGGWLSQAKMSHHTAFVRESMR